MGTKRSAMKAVLENAFPSADAKVIEKILVLFEPAVGSWEPEAPEWPELRRVQRGLGPFCSLEEVRGPGLNGELAERIARAWNARRPGGEMERRLREVADSLLGTTSDQQLRRMIEAALRLGVEGE